ncbi:hypothetical protein E3U43_020454 [Scomber scombrus]|uniref:Uncharacterized protein n=1 Tax=Scomber scombrus TaxID=13677 RepID=A0AAV1Q7K6_SCOSC
MESLPVRRKSCLLRIRENCPFRKLRKQTYDVSAAASSAIGSYWNHINHPTNLQPISTVYSEPLPPLPRCQSDCSANQSKPDVHMEEPPAAGNLQHLQNQQNQQNQQNRADEDCMELDNAIDPETGERAQR